jgi:aryl-alcohol dehydrogenase-like predicted oxidoreductase
VGRTELGCGLIAIGRQWGTTPEVPSEAEAINFLHSAYDLGIRFFDTAPSYGLSEQRLGLFLESLTDEQRKEVRVATKFGEHWDEERQAPYTDHSFEALKSSFDRSRRLLGEIAILQLHKTTPELLSDPDVQHAFAYARSRGVAKIGASISDPESAAVALADKRFNVIQLPYNAVSSQFQDYVAAAPRNDKELIINRPLQMGSLTTNTQSSEEKRARVVEAFRFILQEDFDGVILTGTSNVEHLEENLAAFERAKQ